MPLIAKEYIDTGKVRFVMREFPLTSIHKNAMNAAMAALCAHDQGKYWEMHNIMFENQRELGVDELKSYASTIGLEGQEFNKCLDENQHQQSVQNDLASAVKLGARSTPSFFLGRTDPKDPDNVNLTVYIKGAQGIEQFRASINDLLESAE
jgi:protein-disulfide isomerase